MNLEQARQSFEESTDFTVGLEEEFAILEPETLELEHRFGELAERAKSDDRLADAVAGELIDTEVEIRSGRGENFAEAAELQAGHRARLFALARELGLELGAMGTHPWASYLDQRIIDTPHYRRLREELRWVAQRNNTWSVHVHVGIRGADRAIAVADHLRGLLPPLLALSANSPFLDGRDTGLHSVRSQIFTRSFPRCGVPDSFGDWATYASFVELLERTGSAVESTQLWWSVRPHHAYGTVEFRICEAQSDGADSFNVAALVTACAAQSALDHDEGLLPAPLAGREVEENLWRAIRHGMDGSMIDFGAGAELIPTCDYLERILAWTAPARAAIGVDPWIPPQNGAQGARAALAGGATLREVYRDAVDLAMRSYGGEPAASPSVSPDAR